MIHDSVKNSRTKKDTKSINRDNENVQNDIDTLQQDRKRQMKEQRFDT